MIGIGHAVALGLSLFGGHHHPAPVAVTPPAAVIVEAATEPPVRGPQAIASVDCSHFQMTITGLSDGDKVQVGMGSEPPWGFTVGGNYWGFTPIAGGATADIPVQQYEAAHGFTAVIGITSTGPFRTLFEQNVECGP